MQRDRVAFSVDARFSIADLWAVREDRAQEWEVRDSRLAHGGRCIRPGPCQAAPAVQVDPADVRAWARVQGLAHVLDLASVQGWGARPHFHLRVRRRVRHVRDRGAVDGRVTKR